MSAGFVTSKKHFVPLDLTLEITKECPLNCLICSSEAGIPYSKEFKIDEIKAIIAEAKSMGCQNVCFSGGEPFQCPHLLEICEYTKALGIHVHIYTSGNVRDSFKLLPIKGETLRRIKPFIDGIIFGLQGPTKEIHEAVTRVNGSYANTIESIKVAIKEEIAVEIHFVPVKINYATLPAIVTLAKELKITKVSILRFVPQGRGEEFRRYLDLNEEDLVILKSLLTKISSSQNPRIRIGAPFSIMGISTAKCTAGENRATIRADGLVFPCEGFKHVKTVIDNDIHFRTLNQIWTNSEIFNLARGLAHQQTNGCIKCDKKETCSGGCPAQTLTLAVKSLDPYCTQKETKLIV